MKSVEKIADLRPLDGKSIDTSEWLLIDQGRVKRETEQKRGYAAIS